MSECEALEALEKMGKISLIDVARLLLPIQPRREEWEEEEWDNEGEPDGEEEG